MKYKVEFSKRALKDLKKLDKHTVSLILGWVRKNLEDCENPRLHGKALTADKKGQWRYRIGDFRLLAKIEDERIIILILGIGHRREIYDM